jgi:hypothetical protein
MKGVSAKIEFGYRLGGRDHCHCAVRASILERPVLDIHNPSAVDIHRRSDGGIRDHDDTLSSSKLFVVGFRESDTDIATRCRPRKYDNGFEAFVGANIGFAAIDLELVCLNGNLELPGVGISTGKPVSTNSMSGFGSAILIEAAPPRLPACLIRNAGWLYSGFVALTSRTADAELSSPSFDVIETVAIVIPPLSWCVLRNNSVRPHLLVGSFLPLFNAFAFVLSRCAKPRWSEFLGLRL